LNPSRSFANLMALRRPWYRATRRGISRWTPADDEVNRLYTQPSETPPARELPIFEFTTSSRFERFAGSLHGPDCVGGGATGGFRLTPQWLLVVDVSGCKFIGLEENLSGDSLQYMVGPRWTPAPSRRWSPYLQLLVGGNKITHEQMFPEKKRLLETRAAQTGSPPPLHDEYTKGDESNSFALAAGTGLDLKVNDALAVRLASVEYSRAYVAPHRGLNYSTRLQVTTGIVLRIGTW
jgi:hypothetical protein